MKQGGKGGSCYIITFSLIPGSTVEGLWAESRNKILADFRRSEKKIPDRAGCVVHQPSPGDRHYKKRQGAFLFFWSGSVPQHPSPFPIFSCSFGWGSTHLTTFLSRVLRLEGEMSFIRSCGLDTWWHCFESFWHKGELDVLMNT